MSFQNVKALSLPVDTSGSDIPAGRFVRYESGGLILDTDDGSNAAVGVTLEAWSATDFAAGNQGSVISVAVDGIVEITSGEALTAGQTVNPDTQGRAGNAGSGPYYGFVLKDVAAADLAVNVVLVRGPGRS